MELFDLKAPILDIGNKVGFTNYIDFIRLEDVNYPFMKGIDIYGRKFIVVKMIVNNEIIMDTYFQRYSDNTRHWMVGNHATKRSLLDTVGTGLIPEQIELLKKIISGEIVKIEEKHNTNFGNFIGNYIRLYDEKKENSAKIIQRNWRICRYNPKYKMCEKIQYDDLVDICNT